MKEERLAELFKLYINNSASLSEERELMHLLAAPELVEKKESLIEKLYDTMEPSYKLSDTQAATIFSAVIPKSAAKIISLKEKTFTWRRWAVAASVVLLAGLTGYFLLFNKTEKPTDITKTTTVPVEIKAPKTNRAMITLANGKQIFLDSIANGQITQQGNIKLVKLANGQIAYETATGEVIKEMQYNTLYNPRGSKVIDMKLSDGSHVWLNAGSSVIYPVAFIGNERKVTVDGEAYFEIAHDAAKPFKVSKGDMMVEVLGTHFNVNAYNDEPDLKVTLIEGAVNVTNGTAKTQLKPGQQTVLNNKVQLSPATAVNTDEIIAWKDGLFHFESADLKSILREFARWYNIEIVYEGPVKNRKFFAIVKRSSTLKSVLEMLQDNNIEYHIEGKKLIVKSG